MAGDIIHWNICGLKSKKSPNYNAKIDSLSLLLENVHSTWFLNIQETHISKDEELPEFFNKYDHLYEYIITNSVASDPYSGIILCVRKTEEVISYEILDMGRLLLVKSKNKANNHEMNIFSIYCNP